MNTPGASSAAPLDRPVFVLGEREPALELVGALGDTAALMAVPATRLLADLVAAVQRWGPTIESGSNLPKGTLRPAAWYREVQAAQLRVSGKARTVEFSGLSILRLGRLFPAAQFVVVRRLERPMPRSKRLPPQEQFRVLEVGSDAVTGRETIERVLTFLGEPVESLVLDLSDRRWADRRATRSPIEQLTSRPPGGGRS